MSKNAIWAIVGLMGAALLAIILLQAYWIHGAIKLNETQFDKSVQDALNQVVIGIKEYEDKELHKKNPIDITNATLGLSPPKSKILPSDAFYESKGYPTPTRGIQNRPITKEKPAIIQEIYNNRKPKRLEERIDRKYLRDYLSRELNNRGITIGYEYGIYSNRLKEFIIQNGNYVIAGFSTEQVTETGQSSPLEQSEYEVNLFTNEMDSPGKLILYFPKKSSVVWGGDVWRTLLASFISSAIVLFCFVYTVNVILTQKKLSEMKTDFINNMTHEFKTPIATISLAADSMTNPSIIKNEDKIKRFARIIKQENKRMNNQVEKVLQMASLDKQDFTLNITTVNVHDVIEQAVMNARLQVEHKNGEVSTDLQAKEVDIEADATHLSNIINNLLENANKYSPENPKISVHTRNVLGSVEVIVKDHGIGMSKDARKHIFDKFYRVHTGNIHDVKGFGLGLSYVKAMMDAHKGRIKVKSELGKGSSFILSFPKRLNQSA